MPTYDLICAMNHVWEATCRISDRNVQRCPVCGGLGKVKPSGTPHYHPTKGKRR